MAYACKICIATQGLKGSEIDSLPQTEEELMDHLEAVHHMVLCRKDESREQAWDRYLAKFPNRNKSELRLQAHSVLDDANVIEVFWRGRLVCTVTGGDTPGVRVISKHKASMTMEEPGDLRPGVVTVGFIL